MTLNWMVSNHFKSVLVEVGSSECAGMCFIEFSSSLCIECECFHLFRAFMLLTVPFIAFNRNLRKQLDLLMTFVDDYLTIYYFCYSFISSSPSIRNNLSKPSPGRDQWYSCTRTFDRTVGLWWLLPRSSERRSFGAVSLAWKCRLRWCRIFFAAVALKFRH